MIDPTSTARTPSHNARRQRRRTRSWLLAVPLLFISGWACAQDIPHKVLHLYVGQIRVIPTPPMKRVAVGNGHLLGVTNLARSMLFIAEKPGTTDVYTWTRGGQQAAYHVVITPADNRQTLQEIHALLSSFPGVQAHQSGGQVFLTGYASPSTYQRLHEAVAIYPGVVNLVRPDSVRMKPMVVLDVQVVNFDKDALNHLGIDWENAITGPAVGTVGSFVSNSLYNVTSGFNGTLGNASGTLPLNVPPFASYAGLATTLTSTINLEVKNGQAYLLANPKLVTRSGDTASFLAGGEVPIPVSSGFGQVSVDYKKYGIQLHIKPLIDKQGNILATIKAEVSEINPALTVQGYPGFIDRNTTSVVNVHAGQTIVLSGLIHSTGANTVNKLPWLGDIPILGALFRSTQFQHKQSELVIFVTPEVITPQSADNRALVAQARHYIRRFNHDYARGYFVPDLGHDPDAVPFPRFPHPAAAKTADQQDKTALATTAGDAPIPLPPPNISETPVQETDHAENTPHS
ncbi:type II and III secretion system protein family protein [Acidithiobacillus thiooxidans]|uniref:type II and III secretion system protein family protein n=1 Tax=Acidithiobacillus thiooxidans TaxID=930 RepID=UPI00356610E5|nr:pilus assembly protein N-terminal domain-containing protein [Acidithiobacillus sp.]